MSGDEGRSDRGVNASPCPDGSIVVAVCGPTASGKSELAEALASRLDGEIVSADSMQVYRGMDIGTAKVPPRLRSVPYHCMDLVDPGEPFSVALYQRYAREAIGAITSRGKTAVLCGGTGLYLQSVLYDIDYPAGEQTDNPVRERYRMMAQREGSQALHALLAARDPKSAALIHPHNVRRVIRALEMSDAGVSYAAGNERLHDLRRYYPRATIIGLKVDPVLLARRIDERVETMMEDGLFQEVRRLYDAGLRDALTAPQAIGYKELVPLIERMYRRDAAVPGNPSTLLAEGSDEEPSLSAAVESIKTATRRYAKRQRSWFRRDGTIRWLDATDGVDDHLVASALALIGDDGIKET